MTSTAAVADPPLKIVAVERAARRAERSWWRRHELNGPDAREVADHSWPWLAVTGMLALAESWWITALPLGVLSMILLVSWTTGRHHR